VNADERAKGLTAVVTPTPGGPHFLELRPPGADPVRLGPYQNPGLAKADLARVRKFLAAALRAAAEPDPPPGPP
jgi:hypothetical protein